MSIITPEVSSRAPEILGTHRMELATSESPRLCPDKPRDHFQESYLRRARAEASLGQSEASIERLETNERPV